MQKETSMTKQYRLNQPMHRTRSENKSWCYQNYGPVFPPSHTGATGAACEVRLPAQSRVAAMGPRLTLCSSSPPLQPAALSFLTVSMYSSSHFVQHLRQTEKFEERLINQRLQRKVNKKRWHHVGLWGPLFREGRELQEEIQLPQYR